ncbi:UNVERIFIED_CONTAM: hypothetical protein Slati_1461000 [Sesamum latifolium]|uniref:Endonuclease/exonuclease/phosphatase domain-containing protein n=1 Tax=Sesamum latifolium TaxID=2727402 RepID=A0AAW2X628_9LAMI
MEIVRLHRPGLVFISETKCKARRCDRIKESLNYHGLGVDSVGKGRELLLLWRKDIDVWLQSFSAHHIDVTVKSDDCPARWRFTNFYGYSELAKRKEGWDLLRRLSQTFVRPWLCAGDFNEVLAQHEKQGAFHVLNSKLGTFATICKIVGFKTLDTKNPHMVRARLDRACGDQQWGALFPMAACLPRTFLAQTMRLFGCL